MPKGVVTRVGPALGYILETAPPLFGLGTEIDHPRPLLEQMVLVVDLDQLERGAGAKTFTLGARHVRVVELPFEPALRRRRTALARFEADLERALAGIRTHSDPIFGSDMALWPRPAQVPAQVTASARRHPIRHPRASSAPACLRAARGRPPAAADRGRRAGWRRE